MDPNYLNINVDSFKDHINAMLQEMLNGKEHADVTLVCDDKIQFQAHKIVLSSCSQVFKSLMSANSEFNLNQLIYLSDIRSSEIRSILEFIYLGQATVNQERVDEFINVAKGFEIKGINGNVEKMHDVESTKLVTMSENELSTLRRTISENEQVEPIEENIADLSHTKNFIEDNVTHDGQKFPCDQCDKQYIGKAGQKSLMRHIKISHMGLLFPCDECSYKSSTKSHLNRHKNALHKMKKQELERWLSNITSASIIKL